MAERVTSVPLEAGLYVLRYVHTDQPHGAPTVFVRPSPGCDHTVSVVTPPGERVGSISVPGGCVVIRAEQAGSLQVTIRGAGDRAEAELRLENLMGEQRPGFAGAPMPMMGGIAPTPPALDLPKVEFTGHVSRRGDVRVGGGQWIAGPDSPAPIEGLEARVTGAGVALEYQVLIGGSGGSWTAWMTGGYAGSKGQFRPLLAARLRLVGPQAQQFSIEAEALFLGASVMRVKGQTVELVSGSGVDPLVGLKAALVLAATSGRPDPGRPRIEAPVPPHSPMKAEGRVRVFRASGLR